MASSTRECPVCLEDYDEGPGCPRMLSCGHTLCTRCLEKLPKNGKILCPIDRAVTNAASAREVPKNFALFKARKGAERAGTGKGAKRAELCELCDEEDGVHAATHFCPECGHMCKTVASVHKRMPATKDHPVVPIAEKGKVDLTLLQPPPKCAEHGEELKVFDTVCNRPICVLCIAIDHVGHKCTTLKDAFEDVRKRAEESMKELEERAAAVRAGSALVEAELQELERTRGACRQDIKKQFAELRTRLGAREAELVREVEQLHSERSLTLTAQMSRLQTLAQTLDAAARDMKRATAQQSVASVVAQYKEAEAAGAKATREKDAAALVPEAEGCLVFAIDAAGMEKAVAGAGRVLSKSARAASTTKGPEAASTTKGPEAAGATKGREAAGAAKGREAAGAAKGREAASAAKVPEAAGVAKAAVDAEANEFKREYAREWGGRGEEQGMLDLPTHMAFFEGELYVADYFNSRVQVFEAATGHTLKQFASGPQGGLQGPFGIAINPATRELFVSDYDAHRICVFTLDGTFKRDFGRNGKEFGELSCPTGLSFSTATGPEPELFVCDCSNHRVQVFNPETGACIRMWGSKGNGARQVCSPHDVKVSASGEVYVADSDNHRICVFRPDGLLLRVLGKSRGKGDGHLNCPWSFCLTDSGTMLICDCSHHRIQELACKDGSFVSKWGTSGTDRGEFKYPRGVAVGEKGEVFVCDAGCRVQVFT